MKFDYEGKYFKFCAYIFLVVIASIIFYKMIDNISAISNFIYSFWQLLTPFVFGFMLSYFLNPPVMWLDANIFKYIKKGADYSKRRRLLSILLVYVVFLGLMSLVVIYVAPKVVLSLGDLLGRIPEYAKEIRSVIANAFAKNELANQYSVIQYLDTNIEYFMRQFEQIPNIDSFLGRIMKGVVNFTNVILNLTLALVIGFYFLMGKEKFIDKIKKFLRAILKDEMVNTLTEFGNEVNIIFSGFIIGKTLDSLIIGILCFIGLMIMNVKFALVISLIVGVTNMIPYFGPMIGAVPAIIITFFNSPVKALWVAIFIFVLQQFDGAVLGPKILGKSIGLNPVWIIFAIVVGGGYFGFFGMFLGVPVVAVIKTMVERYIERKLRERSL